MLDLVIAVVLLAVLAAVLYQAAASADSPTCSYYGSESGDVTASGESFDPQGRTAAHKTLPFGTRLLVKYGSKSVVVTVTDRGPYSGNRDLDLSQGAAEFLGLTSAGVDQCEITQLESSTSSPSKSAEKLPDTGIPKEGSSSGEVSKL